MNDAFVDIGSRPIRGGANGRLIRVCPKVRSATAPTPGRSKCWLHSDAIAGHVRVRFMLFLGSNVFLLVRDAMEVVLDKSRVRLVY